MGYGKNRPHIGRATESNSPRYNVSILHAEFTIGTTYIYVGLHGQYESLCLFIKTVLTKLFLLSGPFWLRIITKDPGILAQINIVSG